jgi:membrane protein implicated in regulation of membrane protease activity
MKSVDWRQINWQSVILHAVYVWLLGVAIAFFGTVLRLADSPNFASTLTILVALAVVWASYRVATRAGQQPLVHGLLVGLLVGLSGLLLNLFSAGLGVVEIGGFLMEVLGGLLGGRMAQRVLER